MRKITPLRARFSHSEPASRKSSGRGDEPPIAPLARPVQDQVARAGLARRPVVDRPAPFGTGDAAEQFAEAVASGRAEPPEVLLLYYASPLGSSAHPAIWARALERIPYVVSFSPFLDDTARRADLVLPAAVLNATITGILLVPLRLLVRRYGPEEKPAW